MEKQKYTDAHHVVAIYMFIFAMFGFTWILGKIIGICETCYDEHTQSETIDANDSNTKITSSEEVNYNIEYEYDNEYDSVYGEEGEYDEEIPYDLGDRMKYYERCSKEYEDKVMPYRDFVIRLDGRHFSRLTKFLKNESMKKYGKVYSEAFKNAMIATAEELLIEFKASSAYTHSDEITLIFKKVIDRKTFNNLSKNEKNSYVHLFNGKYDKLTSVVASHATVSFNENIYHELHKENSALVDRFFKVYATGEKTEKYQERFTFDARIIIFPLYKEYEIINHMIWRSFHDCYRNFVSMNAEKHFNNKSLSKKSTVERADMLSKIGINIDNYEICLRYGAFLINKSYTKKINDVDTTRKIAVKFSLPYMHCKTNEYYNLLVTNTTDLEIDNKSIFDYNYTGSLCK